MADLGKALLFLGAMLAAAGAALLLFARLGMPLGRLPGDLAWRSRSGSTQVYFPLATSVILSLGLTLLMWLLRHLRR